MTKIKTNCSEWIESLDWVEKLPLLHQTMNIIKIDSMEGYYLVKDNTLLYIHTKEVGFKHLEVACEVEDLTELKVHEYNELVEKLKNEAKVI